MSIKLNRAKNIAAVGKYPSTWKAIIEAMPETVKTRSTSRQIAIIADAMHGSYNHGHSQGYADRGQ